MEPKERILQMVAENPGMPPFLVPNIGETVQGKNVVMSDKTNDLSFASTETKFQNPITKTQDNFLVNTGFLLKLFQKMPK